MIAVHSRMKSPNYYLWTLWTELQKHFSVSRNSIEWTPFYLALKLNLPETNSFNLPRREAINCEKKIFVKSLHKMVTPLPLPPLNEVRNRRVLMGV